jgi:branched-chain amino acid transport system substrate-binding protein
MDFRSQLTTIRGKKPDAIFIPGYYTDVSLIARQARELGMNIPLLGGDGWDSPKLKEIGGDALDGSYFLNFYTADDPSLNVKNFITSFQAKYNTLPDGSAAMGYEAANFLVHALREAKSLSSSDIRAAMAAAKEVSTLNGKMSIDSARNAVKPAVVLKIEKGTGPKYFVTVNP